MKNIYLYTLLLGLFAFGACSEDDHEPVYSLRTASELTPLTATEFTFNKDNATAAFPTINWSKPDYGFTAVTDYTVTLTNKTTNKSVVLADKIADTKLELTNEGINKFMASTSAYPGQTYDFSITVASHVDKTNGIDNSSNDLNFKATLFDPAAVDWKYVYVATSADWDWTKAFMLGDPDESGVYKGYVNIPNDGVTFSVVDGKNVNEVIAANQSIAKKGFYEISVNAQTGAVTMSVATTWGIVGNATPDEWSKSTALSYDDETKLWSQTIVMKAGEYKFRANDGWDISYGPAAGKETELSGELEITSANFKLTEAAAYIVTLDLTEAGKYSYSLEKTEVELSSEMLVLPGINGDWSDNAPTIYSAGRDFIFTGYQYFPANTEFKFKDGATWYGSSEPGKLGDGPNIKGPDEGYYQVSANIKKLTYTLTPIKWSIIGEAVGGWDEANDQMMTYDPATDLWTVSVQLGTGEWKFRANHGWDINFGADGSANGLKAGGDNFKNATAGNYLITLDLRNDKAYIYKAEKQ